METTKFYTLKASQMLGAVIWAMHSTFMKSTPGVIEKQCFFWQWGNSLVPGLSSEPLRYLE